MAVYGITVKAGVPAQPLCIVEDPMAGGLSSLTYIDTLKMRR